MVLISRIKNGNAAAGVGGLKGWRFPKKANNSTATAMLPWFKQALKQRAKIEPVIGHLKADHRMDRCRYKDPQGDTTNVVWAAAAWNLSKVTRLQTVKQAKEAQRKTKCAA